MRTTQTVLQIHCGRLSQARMDESPGKVFAKMTHLPWNLVTPNIYSWIYLLGVFDYRGEIRVTHENDEVIGTALPRIGSLFAISDHKATHPALGSQTDLKELIQNIQESGGKVMLDFVANHTSIDHPWRQRHPEFYKQVNGSPETQFSQDVIALNYSNQQLWPEMMGVIDQIINWGADGVRCDMAHLVPVEFWQTAIRHARQRNKNFYFLAETYSSNVFDWSPLTQLLDAGFDSVYEEFFYRNLKLIFLEGQSWSFLESHLNYLTGHQPEKYTHYLANHDDPLPEGASLYQEALMALLITLTGKVLIPQGQLVGRTRRLKHHSLEILTQAESSIDHIPIWFETLMKINQTLEPRAKLFQLKDQELSRIELDTNLGPGVLLLNLASATLPVPEDIKKTGKLWDKTQSKELKPGQYQLILNSGL